MLILVPNFYPKSIIFGTIMVGVAQLVRAPDCGSGGRRFEPGLPPIFSNVRIKLYLSSLLGKSVKDG